MATKYVAKYEGKVVGKRTTANRTYTHAVVTQDDEEKARAAAYGYKACGQDRANYEYHLEVAGCEGVIIDATACSWKKDMVGQRQSRGMVIGYDAKEIADHKAEVVGGWTAYADRCREEKIERFERAKKNGAYEPGVATWCGRHDLAVKEANKRRGWNNIKMVAIVPAEKV